MTTALPPYLFDVPKCLDYVALQTLSIEAANDTIWRNSADEGLIGQRLKSAPKIGRSIHRFLLLSAFLPLSSSERGCHLLLPGRTTNTAAKRVAFKEASIPCWPAAFRPDFSASNRETQYPLEIQAYGPEGHEMRRQICILWSHHSAVSYS